MRVKKTIVPLVVLALVLVCVLSSCKTKSEIRREQELARLRYELRAVRGSRADVEVGLEELKNEMAKMANLIEERAQYQAQQFELLASEIQTMNLRMQVLEGGPPSSQTKTEEKLPITLKSAQDLVKAKRYGEAVEVLKELIRNTPKGKDKDARFLLAETYFTQKEYALAAIEFGEFKKRYPKDKLIPKAIFHQGQSFNRLNKKKEARLFFQELIDNYPKSQFAQLAKKEMK